MVPLLALLVLGACSLVSATLRTYELHVGPKELNPDCFNQSYPSLVVNGQSPGPILRATKGDQVHIIIQNGLDSDPVTIHFHGIFQIGTVQSDGMPNVTQAAIPSGETFHLYFWVGEQAGTYYYHSHSDLEDQSVFGAFIVHETDDAWPNNLAKPLCKGPYTYDSERVVLLSEWWHQSQKDRLDYLLGDDYQGLTVPNSVLINGMSWPDNASSHHCRGYPVIDVLPNLTYRLRVIGSLTFNTMGFAIAHHKMTVIEVDGISVEPFETDYLEVSPGRRFSVLIRTDQKPASYYMLTTTYYLAQSPPPPTLGIFRYVGLAHRIGDLVLARRFESTHHKATVPDLPTFPPGFSQWYFPQLKPLAGQSIDASAAPDRTVMIVPVERTMPDNTTRWFINNHPPPMWDVPLLYQLMANGVHYPNRTVIEANRDDIGSDGYDSEHQTYPLAYGEVVDFVIQTTVIVGGICPVHPWHTHGMIHYAIAYGEGAYHHHKDKDLRNYPHPTAKDVSLVYAVDPDSTEVGEPCGWTKIRVFAKNPGVWGFHCHITGHMLQGMMTVLELAPDKIPILST